ncbi:CYTH domain-containing protein [soil metagenome]
MIEIERKFLVKSADFRKDVARSSRIIQGFLNTDPSRTVRIRINGDTAFITIKGKTNQSGLSRYEWEKEIGVEEAEELLALCLPGKIDKMRHLVFLENHTIEVDEFLGLNQGLIIAEIELKNEKENYPRPAWLGKEVTGEPKYYNSQLSERPFNSW